MNTKLPVLAIAASLAWIGPPSPAAAQTTVECISHNYQYNECYAPLRKPQLIHQQSHASCIVNRTWGFNARTSRIWVSEGCSGVFADPGGYHYGQAGSFDKGARTYDERGHDTGALVAGAVLGAMIEGAATSGKKSRQHTTTNNYYYTHNSDSGYTGCHGVGCLVDDPEQEVVDDRPQFDKEGNPNFDTHGNYIGCHGVGCEVDSPDSDSDSSADPPEPGQTTFSDDSGSDGSDDDD
jgi:hypothetical protein